MDGTKTAPAPFEVLQGKKRALIRAGNRRRLLAGLACSALLVLAIFGEVFGIAIVHGISMQPSFRDRDIVLYSRLGAINAGDIVIFLPPGENKKTKDNEHIKRVIGLPGEIVFIGPGAVAVNGETFPEPYAAGYTGPKPEVAYPLILTDKQYFVLGDNREHSIDSREEGPIGKERISGRVIASVRFRQ